MGEYNETTTLNEIEHNPNRKAYAMRVGFFRASSTLGMFMAEKRANKAALSANHGWDAWPLFMTMWQTMVFLSLIFSLPFWQGEISFGRVGKCQYLCRVV